MFDNKDINVIVTDKHIKHGSKKECFDCPIAYAIIDALSKTEKEKQYYYRKVSVAKTIKILNYISYDDIELPEKIKKWIMNFDYGKKVSGISFTIQRVSIYPSVPSAKIINVKKRK